MCGVVALRPTCVEAHNNIALYDISYRDEGDGISRLRLAHKIEPDNSLVAENFKQAKSVRSDRRLNNVLKVLEVTADVLLVAAAAYDTTMAIQNNSAPASSSLSMSSGSYGTSSVSSSASSSASNADSYVRMYNKWEGIAKSIYENLAGKSIYSNTPNESSSNKLSVSTYSRQRSLYRDAQNNMVSYRKKAERAGAIIVKSDWETKSL